MLRYPAVQLFVRRVAARAGSFVLTDEEAPFVAEMCRKLDGIPLAIELAAGQVAALGLKNTVARLVSRLELLKLSHRTAVPRHRTLKATLDWSYDLLSDAERIVLRRIAPFVGHFTLEGARYVAGELGAGTGEIFDAIAGLVEKSLIATRIDETQAQYRLLDTTRAYALEKLEEHAEVDVVLRRHAEYVAGYLESQREALLALLPKAEQSCGLFACQFSQLGKSARRWNGALGLDGDDEIATRLAAASTQLFLELSLLIECRDLGGAGDRPSGRSASRTPAGKWRSTRSLPLALMHTEGSKRTRPQGFFSGAGHCGPKQGDLAYELRLLSGLFLYSCWTIDINARSISPREAKRWP